MGLAGKSVGGVMIAKKLAATGVGIALVLGGAAVVLNQFEQIPVEATAGLPRGADDGAPDPPGPDVAKDAAAKDADAKGAETGPGIPSVAPTGAPPGAQSPATAVLEVLPPVSAPPTGLPMPSPRAALVRAPLPPAGSAQGKVVAGFPISVITFPDGTLPVFTSISAADEKLQITADGIVPLSPEQVVVHFQQSLLKFGFESEAAPAAEGQRAVRMWSGRDVLTLSVSAAGTGSTRFTLLGSLHAASEG